MVIYNLAVPDVHINGLVLVGGSLACCLGVKTDFVYEIVQVLVMCQFFFFFFTYGV